MPDLDGAVIRLDAHQRGDTLRPIALARPDGEVERIIAGCLSVQVSAELRCRGKGTVGQIVPDALPVRVAVTGRKEIGSLDRRIERLDDSVATLVGTPLRAWRGRWICHRGD